MKNVKRVKKNGGESRSFPMFGRGDNEMERKWGSNFSLELCYAKWSNGEH